MVECHLVSNRDSGNNTHPENASLPVNADALALVKIGLSVSCRNALGVARRNEAVEDVGDHFKFGGSSLDLSRADSCVGCSRRGAASKTEKRHYADM